MKFMLQLLSKIYLYFVIRRNNKFDKGEIPVFKAEIPVISVGNISTGGTGKTPFVILLAKILNGMGKKPAIIGRGYKKKKKGMVIVSDGKNILTDSSQAGDEMVLLAAKTGMPVIAHEKKFLAAKRAVELFNPDCLIVDDGFQHRYLARDLDIVMVNDKTFTEPCLMPYGRLREPLEGLQRADVICHDFNFNMKLFAGFIVNKECLVVNYKIKSDEICTLNDARTLNDDEITALKKSGVIALSGIANPGRFKDFAGSTGITVKYHYKFGDHHNYSLKDMIALKKGCNTYKADKIITTEKDAVKLKNFSGFFEKNNLDVYVLRIKYELLTGGEDLKKKIKELFS